MKHLVAASCVALALAVPAHAGPALGAPDAQAVKAFVQGFYDWYAEASQRDCAPPGVELALEEKSALFDAKLMRALREDLDASAKSPDKVVGLDFDPFLNAQDVCAPYKVGNIGNVGDSGKVYRVEVSGSCAKSGSHKPDVIAVVRVFHGQLIFADFMYPGNGDLLDVLKSLKAERRKK